VGVCDRELLDRAFRGPIWVSARTIQNLPARCATRMNLWSRCFKVRKGHLYPDIDCTHLFEPGVRVILHQPERPERPNAERPYRNLIGRRGIGWDAWPMDFQYGRSAFGRSGRSGWCRMTLSILRCVPDKDYILTAKYIRLGVDDH